MVNFPLAMPETVPGSVFTHNHRSDRQQIPRLLFLCLSLSLRGPAFLSLQLRLDICCNFLMHFMFTPHLWKIHILSDAGTEIIGSLLLQTRQENEQDAVF